jgi:hypothetical protein
MGGGWFDKVEGVVRGDWWEYPFGASGADALVGRFRGEMPMRASAPLLGVAGSGSDESEDFR